MAKVTIEFDTGGAAFEHDGCGEVSAILKRLAGHALSASTVKNCVSSLDGLAVRDSYGSDVGKVTVKGAAGG